MQHYSVLHLRKEHLTVPKDIHTVEALLEDMAKDERTAVLKRAIRAKFGEDWPTVLTSKNHFSVTDSPYTITHLYKIKGGYGTVRHLWSKLLLKCGFDVKLRISWQRMKEHTFKTETKV